MTMIKKLPNLMILDGKVDMAEYRILLTRKRRNSKFTKHP